MFLTTAMKGGTGVLAWYNISSIPKILALILGGGILSMVLNVIGTQIGSQREGVSRESRGVNSFHLNRRKILKL